MIFFKLISRYTNTVCTKYELNVPIVNFYLSVPMKSTYTNWKQCSKTEQTNYLCNISIYLLISTFILYLKILNKYYV